MLNGGFATVFDAVSALRSSWLYARGPDSFVQPSEVRVYIDGQRAGSVEVLRNVQATLVNTVRFYDGPTATAQWGVDHGAGVIYLSTWSNGAPGIPLADTMRAQPAAPRDTGKTP
jgi:hypothetical protein